MHITVLNPGNIESTQSHGRDRHKKIIAWWCKTDRNGVTWEKQRLTLVGGSQKRFTEKVLLGLGLEGREEFATGDRKGGWYSKVEGIACPKTQNSEVTWLPWETASRQEDAPAGTGGGMAREEAGPHEGPLVPSQGSGAFFSPIVEWNRIFWNGRDLREHLVDKETETHTVTRLNYVLKNRTWYKSSLPNENLLKISNKYITYRHILFLRYAPLQMMDHVLLGLQILTAVRSWVCQCIYCTALRLMLRTLTHTMQVGVQIGTALLKGSFVHQNNYEIWTAWPQIPF